MGHSERASIFDGNDPKTRVQDDVFRAVNGGWLETTEIPEDLPWIGSFVELVLQAEKHVREIIEDLAKTEETDPHPGRHAQRDGAEQTDGNANESGEAHKDAHKIGALFSSWMDVDALNAKGTAPLRADLAPVEAATDREGLARVVGELRAAGVPAFFNWDIDADLADPDTSPSSSSPAWAFPTRRTTARSSTPKPWPNTRILCRGSWPSATASARRRREPRPTSSFAWRPRSPPPT